MESTAGSDWFGMTITHDFSAGGGFKSCPRKMTRKLSKEEIKDKFDGEELDLSLCNLAKVPVREMVSVFHVRSKIASTRAVPCFRTCSRCV